MSKIHWARFWQNAASCFPHSIWFCSSTDGLDHIVRNRPGSNLVLGGHVGLWPNGSGPEASWWARIIGPGSGKTQPARIRFDSGWPCPVSGQTDLIWKQAGVQESSGPVLANRIRTVSGPVPACLLGLSFACRHFSE